MHLCAQAWAPASEGKAECLDNELRKVTQELEASRQLVAEMRAKDESRRSKIKVGGNRYFLGVVCQSRGSNWGLFLCLLGSALFPIYVGFFQRDDGLYPNVLAFSREALCGFFWVSRSCAFVT